jgi:hypothetical protein
MIARQTEAGNAPTSNVPEAQRAASLNYTSERRAAGVSSAENAAHARSRDVRNGDLVLLEHLQNTEMRKPARKTSAQSEANACPDGHGGCTFVQGFARNVAVPRHAIKIAGGTSSTYGSRVLI